MDLPPEDELARDVYAHFGLAYYWTECVHRGLVMVFALLHASPQGTSRPRIEERLVVAEQMTLGELVPATKPHLPVELHASLDWALATRNFYAHGFWFERIHMMFTAEGQREVIEELTRATDLLRSLDATVDQLTLKRLREIGVTKTQLDQALQESRVKPPNPIPARRIPRADERIDIVEGWVVPSEGDRAGLLLRDAVGEMWQLCDAGLGWSYEERGANWRPAAKLAGLLPAGIVARPRGAKPWNYKLHVSTGALICVDRDDPSGPFRWRIERLVQAAG